MSRNGNVPEAGRLRFDEPVLATDLVGLARPLVKWAAEVQRVQDIPNATRRAVQVAVLEAPSLAANLVHLLRGEPTTPYSHKEKGDLVALGRTQAAARLRRFAFITAPHDVVFGGFPAWTVWRVNYLLQLLGVRNRATLLTEWLLSYFTTRMVSNIP